MATVHIINGNLGDYDYIVGTGTVEVKNTTSADGTFSDLSLEMVWPNNDQDAGIETTVGDPVVNDITGFSYWVKAAEYFNPHLTMFLDTTGNDTIDTEARIGTYNVGSGDTWVEIDSSGTISFWIVPNGGSSRTYSWADFQTEFGTAVVKKIRISHYGYYIGTSEITAYLDDFTFGGTDYVFGIEDLTANVGAFTLTGITAILTKALNMTASVGSFTLTGITTALKRGYTIATSVGSFTLTGIATTFTKALNITTAVGEFILTGISVTLLGPSAGTNMKINISDSWKDVSGIKINIGGSWKDVNSIKQNISGSWKDVF